MIIHDGTDWELLTQSVIDNGIAAWVYIAPDGEGQSMIDLESLADGWEPLQGDDVPKEYRELVAAGGWDMTYFIDYEL